MGQDSHRTAKPGRGSPPRTRRAIARRFRSGLLEYNAPPLSQSLSSIPRRECPARVAPLSREVLYLRRRCDGVSSHLVVFRQKSLNARHPARDLTRPGVNDPARSRIVSDLSNLISPETHVLPSDTRTEEGTRLPMHFLAPFDAIALRRSEITRLEVFNRESLFTFLRAFLPPPALFQKYPLEFRPV